MVGGVFSYFSNEISISIRARLAASRVGLARHPVNIKEQYDDWIRSATKQLYITLLWWLLLTMKELL